MTIKFNIKQTLNGAQILQTLHYQPDPVSGQITANEIAQGIRDAYADHLVGILADQWSLDEITYVDPDAGGGAPALPAVITGLPLAGAANSVSMANRTTCRVNFKATENAPYRGGSNLSGMYEAGMDAGNVFTSAVIDAVQLWANDLLGITNASGEIANLVIRSTGSSIVPVGTTSLVVDAVVNPKPKTLRSRD